MEYAATPTEVSIDDKLAVCRRFIVYMTLEGVIGPELLQVSRPAASLLLVSLNGLRQGVLSLRNEQLARLDGIHTLLRRQNEFLEEQQTYLRRVIELQTQNQNVLAKLQDQNREMEARIKDNQNRQAQDVLSVLAKQQEVLQTAFTAIQSTQQAILAAVNAKGDQLSASFDSANQNLINALVVAEKCKNEQQIQLVQARNAREQRERSVQARDMEALNAKFAEIGTKVVNCPQQVQKFELALAASEKARARDAQVANAQNSDVLGALKSIQLQISTANLLGNGGAQNESQTPLAQEEEEEEVTRDDNEPGVTLNEVASSSEIVEQSPSKNEQPVDVFEDRSMRNLDDGDGQQQPQQQQEQQDEPQKELNSEDAQQQQQPEKREEGQQDNAPKSVTPQNETIEDHYADELTVLRNASNFQALQELTHHAQTPNDEPPADAAESQQPLPHIADFEALRQDVQKLVSQYQAIPSPISANWADKAPPKADSPQHKAQDSPTQVTEFPAFKILADGGSSLNQTTEERPSMERSDHMLPVAIQGVSTISSQDPDEEQLQEGENYNEDRDEEAEEEDYQRRKIFDDEIVRQLCQQVNLNFTEEDNALDLPSLQQIFNLTAELAAVKYKSLCTESRKERREVLRSVPENGFSFEYLQLIEKFQQSVDALIEIAQDQILHELDIDKVSGFQESILILMESSMGNEVLRLQTELNLKIKSVMPFKRLVEKKEMLDIVAYEVKLLEDPPLQIKRTIEQLKQFEELEQNIPQFLSVMLLDYVHARFGVEEEDYNKNAILQNDQDIQELKQKVAELISSLLPQIE